jgi:hypothetical protein
MPIPDNVLSVMEWLVATALVYLAIGRIIRPLVTPFVAFELASTSNHAKRVLMTWQDAKQIRRVLCAIVLETLLIPLYVVTAWKLMMAVNDEQHPVVGVLNVFVATAMTLAGLAHFVENIGLVVTLTIGARPAIVFFTRFLGWFKYTVMALTTVWLIFQAEAYLYVWLGKQQSGHKLGWLLAAMVIVGLLVARQLTRLSRNRPSLLALQFAPSRLAAKDILEQWGSAGRAMAARALLLESALAVLYGLTLAVTCERIDPPVFDGAAVYIGWLMLTAAACHLAQNVGAYVAVRRRTMGWWVGMMRRVGRLRLALLGVTALYFLCLLVWVEWSALAWIGARIKPQF